MTSWNYSLKEDEIEADGRMWATIWMAYSAYIGLIIAGVIWACAGLYWLLFGG